MELTGRARRLPSPPGLGALPPVRNADITAYLENGATPTDAKALRRATG
jgi:hypothetical protein